MKRIVLDSTILVSAFLVRGGAAEKVLRSISVAGDQIVVSNLIFAETSRVLLTYTRIRKRYSYYDDDVRYYLRGIEAVSSIVNPLWIPAISRDPNDDDIIACAVTGHANTIITRDKDLLILKSHNNVEIVDPERYLKALRPAQSLAVKLIRKERS